MSYINRSFPTTSQSAWPGNNIANPALQAPGVRLEIEGVEEIYSGSLTYLQFVRLVKKLWEESHPMIPILPVGMNRESFITYQEAGSTNEIGINSTAPSSTSVGVDSLDEFPAIIGYSLELRKAHTTEPKPRMRQNILSNSVTIYGQKFQNVVAFTVMSKARMLQGNNPSSTRDDLDTAVLCDQIVESFEDFMTEYTPILKAAGASELVYSRRLSDSDVGRDNKNIHKRTVTYMLTTEKTFAIRNDRIEKIKVDIRTWMATDNIPTEIATPNFKDVEVDIVDLYQSASPSY